MRFNVVITFVKLLNENLSLYSAAEIKINDLMLYLDYLGLVSPLVVR